MSRETNSGRPAVEPLSASVPDTAKKQDGQHVDHWILSEEERNKGFVRPVRRTYLHLKCNTVTSMPDKIAETYARDPRFYGQTFCCMCQGYFPVGDQGEFVWEDDDKKVGT